MQFLKSLPFLLLLAAALLLFLFPGVIRRLFRGAGSRVGNVGRAGRELMGGEEVRGSPLARYESAAGRAVEERILSTHPPDPDPFVQGRVDAIGRRLAALARRREIPYRFLVVIGPEPTAYSLPGGAVLVSRPLVDIVGPDDHQLAGVLAHEVVHIDQRHAIRNLAKTAAARAGLRLLTLGRGALLGRAVGALEASLAKGYTEAEEMEADRLAVQLAGSAGFDPRAYPFFLRGVLDRRLDRVGYFRTHPAIPVRLHHLGAWPAAPVTS